jgi:hypothetical protein
LTRLLNIYGADKLFFHLFQSFFERPSGHTCRVNTPFTGTRQGLASFFFDFFEVFFERPKPEIHINRHGFFCPRITPIDANHFQNPFQRFDDSRRRSHSR